MWTGLPRPPSPLLPVLGQTKFVADKAQVSNNLVLFASNDTPLFDHPNTTVAVAVVDQDRDYVRRRCLPEAIHHNAIALPGGRFAHLSRPFVASSLWEHSEQVRTDQVRIVDEGMTAAIGRCCTT